MMAALALDRQRLCVTLVTMAKSAAERQRAYRERRKHGIERHACNACGTLHYPVTPVTHDCPDCGVTHVTPSLTVTPVTHTPKEGEPTVTPVTHTPKEGEPTVTPVTQPCQACAGKDRQIAALTARAVRMRGYLNDMRAELPAGAWEQLMAKWGHELSAPGSQ